MNNIKNRLANIDFSTFFKILSDNKFLILFITVLFVFVGYIYESQKTLDRKFSLTLSLVELDEKNKTDFKLLNNALFSLDSLELENIYLKMISATNVGVGDLFVQENDTNLGAIAAPLFANSLNREYQYIAQNSIQKMLYSAINDFDFMTIVSSKYNQYIRKEFQNDPEKMDIFLLKNDPTFLTLMEESYGIKRINVKVFFADNYHDFIVKKFTQILIENLNIKVNFKVLEIIEIYEKNYERKRKELLSVLSKLIKYYSYLPRASQIYNQKTLEEFENFKTKENTDEIINYLKIREGNLKFFKDIDMSSQNHPSMTVKVIANERLYATFFLGLIGLFCGIFLSLINFYFKSTKMIN